MRRVLMTALVGAAVTALSAAPAQAAVDLTTSVSWVATFNGPQCTGGGITTCYAPTLTQVGTNGLPVPGSPGILSFGPSGGDGTGTTTGFSDWITQDSTTGHFLLNFDYTGTEVATYIGVFQGGAGLNCANCNNTYQLFGNPGGITTGTIDLTYYFANENTGAISHVDLFDNGSTRLPEPGSWALMLLGFAGVGVAMRRSRKANGRLLQIA